VGDTKTPVPGGSGVRDLHLRAVQFSGTTALEIYDIAKLDRHADMAGPVHGHELMRNITRILAYGVRGCPPH
jgi:hypothetical protein